MKTALSKEASQYKCEELWRNRERNRFLIIGFVAFWIFGYIIITVGVPQQYYITKWKTFDSQAYEDTYVSVSNPNLISGNETVLKLSKNHTIYLKFNLNGLTTVDPIQIEFFCYFINTIPYKIRYTGNNWNEDSLTYQTLINNELSSPQREPFLNDHPIIVQGTSDRVNIPDLRSVIGTDMIFSLVIQTTSNTLSMLNTADSDSESHFYLQIRYIGVTNVEIYIFIVYSIIMIGILFFVDKAYRMNNIYYDYYCTDILISRLRDTTKSD